MKQTISAHAAQARAAEADLLAKLERRKSERVAEIERAKALESYLERAEMLLRDKHKAERFALALRLADEPETRAKVEELVRARKVGGIEI